MSQSTADIIWKQAVQFDSSGGWTEDCQFVDQVGFAYLLATGIGQPVADAITTLTVSHAGSYRLWVRCKDWYPSHSPGRFHVVVDGKASPTLFGKADHTNWHWVDGGEFELATGDVEVRLADQTGWWSRCDAVVLSSDRDFRPSDDFDILQQQRCSHGAISATIEKHTCYDALVVGGGLAGVAAAVASARHGARVALLQDRPVLGGNASAEICVPALGDETREPWDPRETGVIEECDPAITGKSGWSTNLQCLVDSQPNLDLYSNVQTTGVIMAGERITSIKAMEVRTGKRFEFEGAVFIDCTGDGTVGYAAGADYRHGKESRSEFNESLAPVASSQRTMGNTLFGGQVVSEPRPTTFETPAWAYQWRLPSDFEQRSTAGVWSTGNLPVHFESDEQGGGRCPDSAMGPVGCWFAEIGGMYDTITDAEFIRDELFRLGIGLWGYVKNYAPEFKETNQNRRLAVLNHVAGKRESRRLLGDYVLTQHDYQKQTIHDDTIAYGGWTIDDHHPQGYFAPGPLAYHAYLQKVSIPYRCLYSRNVSNLMMAGRNVSATHVGFSGIRVMRTCCVMGQAAGTAAAIAVREQTTPRGVYDGFLPHLQQMLLKDGAYLLGVKNIDSLDLARTATVTASSSATASHSDWLANPVSKWGTVHRMDTKRAVMFRASENHIKGVSLFLRNRSAEPIRVQLSLHQAEEFGNFAAATEVALGGGVVPGNAREWIDFTLDTDVTPGELYYLALPATDDLDWEMYPYHAPETLRGYDGPKWGALWGCYKFRLTPGGEPPASPYAATGEPYVFAPSAVVDGRNRSMAGEPCSWAANPELPLPASLELCFPKPVTINTVHVTYQLASLAASHYRVEGHSADGWQPLVEVVKNRARRRVHRFNAIATDRLRLVIESGQPRPPSPIIPVCEIRVYNEVSPITDGECG